MTNLEQKKEALARMKMLGLHENVIKEFEKDSILNVSEVNGFLYWVGNEDEKKWLDEWQKETGNLVYHLIRTNTEFGKILNILYISQYEEEWESEKEEIKEDVLFSYVKNLDVEEFSEYGRIGITKATGGLIRIS